MNGIILIRDGKVAFSRHPGDYGDDGLIAFDLKDMMTPHGLFIPLNNAATQVLPMLNPSKMFNMFDVPGMFNGVTADKGLLIHPIADGKLQFERVRLSNNMKLSLGTLAVGREGSAILSSYDHLVSTMGMCVLLTKTIEETIAMYGRHAKTNVNHTVIWTQEQIRDFISENWTPQLEEGMNNNLAR